MAFKKLSRRMTVQAAVDLSAARLVYTRIRQARGLVQVLDVALGDGLDDRERLELTNPVLQKLARATNDLLEQAEEAMFCEEPNSYEMRRWGDGTFQRED
jgi:hypothetical protein